MVGVIAIVTNQPVEGSPSPGTCLPLDKGGTGCDVLPVASGGTGGSTASDARDNLGIGIHIVDTVTSNEWIVRKYSDGRWTGSWRGTLSCATPVASSNIYRSTCTGLPAAPAGLSGNIYSMTNEILSLNRVAGSGLNPTLYIYNTATFSAMSPTVMLLAEGTWQ